LNPPFRRFPNALIVTTVFVTLGLHVMESVLEPLDLGMGLGNQFHPFYVFLLEYVVLVLQHDVFFRHDVTICYC
jgi:hypothetical protein